MSTLSSANVAEVSLVPKERTHKIKIKYSMHQYSILMHILGNWLIECSILIHCVHQKKSANCFLA